ncbi:hypothetical protein ACFJIW_20640 [Tahibacter sp. UC22_41]|uniref:hypothetical protein n=1 Tax=Tahibacter sp. UC22_41 TaxID=3350178 RepID=UPI0036DB87B4
MTDVLEFLAAIGIGAAALSWLAKSLVTHWLSRDIDSYKSRLAHQHSIELEKIKSDLGLVAKQYEKRMTLLLERRASVIAGLWSELSSLESAANLLLERARVLHGDFKDLLSDKSQTFDRELADQFFAACDAVEKRHRENDIYLPADLCTKIEEFTRGLQSMGIDSMVVGTSFNSLSDGGATFLDSAQKASNDILSMKQALREALRELME